VAGGFVTGLTLTRSCFSHNKSAFDDGAFFHLPFEDSLDDLDILKESENNEKGSLQLVIEDSLGSEGSGDYRDQSIGGGGGGSQVTTRVSLPTPLPGTVEHDEHHEKESENRDWSNGHKERLTVPADGFIPYRVLCSIRIELESKFYIGMVYF